MVLLKIKGVSGRAAERRRLQRRVEHAASVLAARWQNKPFGPYACTGDAESLNKTWRAAMVSRDVLEHGERLSNLGWRMYHMRANMVPVSLRSAMTALSPSC